MRQVPITLRAVAVAAAIAAVQMTVATVATPAKADSCADAGDIAVIHGVNTVSPDGRVLDREQFADVIVLQDGVWMALSAQEAML